MTSRRADISTQNAMPILQQLRKYISQRYAEQTGKSLWQIYQLEPELLRPSSGLLRFASSERQGIAATLEIDSIRQLLIRQCCEMTRAFTQQRNQFITFSASDERTLVQIYTRFLHRISLLVNAAHSMSQFETLFQNILKEHFLSLRAFTRSFFVDDPALPIHEQFLFKEPVCREYSASLQVEMLGIDETQLKEPILDIGCGESGQLVKFLKKRGYEAFGVDRGCPSSERFENVDWLDLELRKDHWGSILSHMAFSNHFLFQHLYKYGRPQRYAAKFMEMLAALQPGGSLYYTPGLPFIESLLPGSHYSYRRTPVSNCGAKNLNDDPYKQFTGRNVLYSTRIRRTY